MLVQIDQTHQHLHWINYDKESRKETSPSPALVIKKVAPNPGVQSPKRLEVTGKSKSNTIILPSIQSPQNVRQKAQTKITSKETTPKTNKVSSPRAKPSVVPTKSNSLPMVQSPQNSSPKNKSLNFIPISSISIQRQPHSFPGANTKPKPPQKLQNISPVSLKGNEKPLQSPRINNIKAPNSKAPQSNPQQSPPYLTSNLLNLFRLTINKRSQINKSNPSRVSP